MERMISLHATSVFMQCKITASLLNLPPTGCDESEYSVSVASFC